MNRRFRSDESGATLVFVCISLPLILLLLVLVIDMDVGRLTRNRLQITADSSALAGAAVLPIASDVNSEAIQYANLNYPVALAGSPVLTTSDIQIGNWDRVNRVFTEGGVPINAVRTTTRRDSTNNNPLQAIFGLIAGWSEYEIDMSAVAVNGAGVEFPCIGGGILTQGEFNGQSNNDWNSFCVYSDIRVAIQSDNNVNEGTIFAMPDEDDYEHQGNNSYFDFENQIISDTWSLPTLAQVSGFINDAQAGTLPAGLPFSVDNVVVRNSDIDTNSYTLNQNTLYIVDGSVVLDPVTNHTNIAIVATGDITVSSDGSLTNAVLMSEAKITVGSYVDVGTVNACTDNGGDFGVYMFAEDNIEFGSNNDLFGIQAATLGDLRIESNANVVGFYGESVTEAEVQSNGSFGACDNGLGSAFGPLTNAMIAGDMSLVLVD